MESTAFGHSHIILSTVGPAITRMVSHSIAVVSFGNRRILVVHVERLARTRCTLGPGRIEARKSISVVSRCACKEGSRRLLGSSNLLGHLLETGNSAVKASHVKVLQLKESASIDRLEDETYCLTIMRKPEPSADTLLAGARRHSSRNVESRITVVDTMRVDGEDD